MLPKTEMNRDDFSQNRDGLSYLAEMKPSQGKMGITFEWKVQNGQFELRWMANTEGYNFPVVPKVKLGRL